MLVVTVVVEGTLIMQTCGPTLRIMDRRSAGEVTSIETQRLVCLVRIISMSCTASGFVVFAAMDSYDMVVVVDHDSLVLKSRSN